MFTRKPMIPVLRIEGSLDSLNTRSIEYSLTRDTSRFKKGPVLAIVLDSKGGSAVQADNLRSVLKDFCEKHHMKLYIFIEAYALSASAIPMYAADKVFAEKSSRIGHFNACSELLYSTSDYGAKRWTAPNEK